MRGFIELKLYVDDETKWNDVINKLVKNINECQEIIEKMEEFSIDQQENTLRMYLESKNWIAQLEDAKKKAELKIQEMRPKLIREQKKKNEELKKNLELLNIKIHAFANCYDLEFAEEYNGNSKRVMGELIELEDNAREYEENEIHLTMNPKTNFDEVFDARANFDKYYKLWDFYCDKWQAVSIKFPPFTF